MRIRATSLLLIAIAASRAYAGDPASNRGVDLAGVYHVNDIDNVNLFNGNLIVDVPLATQFPLNGGFSYGIHLVYTGQPWDFQMVMRPVPILSDPPGPPPGIGYETKALPVPNRRSNAGMGWRVTMGRLLLGPGADTPPCDPDYPCPYPIYESPDGAQHEISGGTTTGSVATSYTADGSYLRLKRYLDLGYEELEFPDGSIHRFDSTGRLINIFTPFDRAASGIASVTIDYLDNDTSNQCHDSIATSCWKIHDVFGRNQYVTFGNTSDLYTGKLAHKIVITAPGAGTVAYTLHYNGQSAFDPANNPPLPLDTCYTRWREATDPTSYNVPLLTSIDLPDGSKYEIEAHNTAEPSRPGDPPGYCMQGSLENLTLPTRGKLSYGYTDWTLLHPRFYDPPYLPGVLTRTKTPAGGGTAQIWTYQPAVDAEYWGPGCQPNPDCPHELRARTVTVTDPDHRVTRHYFSNVPTPATSEQISGGGWTPAEIGLPFTRDTAKTATHPKTGDTYYLSSEVLDADGHVERSNYVQYEYEYAESDATTYSHEKPANFRREKASLTKYAADVAGHDPQNNPILRWSSIVRSDFDQFGHYRLTVTDGNFATESSTQDQRAEYVDYNPSHPTWAAHSAPSWSTGDPWILGTFDYQWIKVPRYPNDAPSTMSHTKKAEFCFEANTGVLSRRRLLLNDATTATATTDVTVADAVAQNGADVITEFGRLTHNGSLDLTGNVLSEKSYGGDTPYGADLVSMPSGSLCGLTLPAPRYQLWHTYQNGVRATSEYYDGNSPMGFKILDRTIDLTGVIASERDVSGVPTTYIFDPDDLLRVKTVQRPGTASVSYAYAPASSTSNSFTPPQITVTQGDTTSRVQYDSFGRIWREFRTMPVGEVTRETLYDAANRKLSRSLWASGSYANKTSYHYDFRGRVDSVDPPDHQIVTTSYAGDSRRTTSSAVMASVDPAAAQTTTSTTEQMDRYGRLLYVIEPNAKVTAYGYGVTGALARVCMGATLTSGVLSTASCGQQRLFTYDNRGFLTSESHPENGKITYTYDATGHVLTKRPETAGTIFDLNYTYDAAERLLQIDSWCPLPPPLMSFFRPSKVFTFAASNGATNLRQGKLETATRHNYHPSLGDIRVIETYEYNDAAGRLTDRTTDIKNVGNNTINQSVKQTQTYDTLGLPSSTTYPYCVATACGTPSSAYGYFNHTNGLLTEVGTQFAGNSDYAALTYHPNGMLNAVSHANGVNDTYSYDSANGLPRPKSISFGNFGSCVAPTIGNLPTPVVIPSGGQATLTASASGSGTLKYYWHKDNLSPVVATSSTYTTDPSTSEHFYYVQVVNSCGTAHSNQVQVSIATGPTISGQPQSVTLQGPGSAHLTVSASGASLTYQWYQGTSGSGTTVGSNQPSYDTPVLNTTTSYWVRVSNMAGSVNSNTATVTIPPPALAKPNAFSAAMLTTTAVQLSWAGVPGAQHYEIWRREYAGGLHKVSESTTAGYTDSPVSANTAYVYQVCASPGSTTACTSLFSDQDLATTVSFTSLTQETGIRAAHLNQLLDAVNVVRAANPGSAGTLVTWAQILQGSPAPPAPALNGIVYGEHILALRRTLDAALQTLLGIAPAAYIDPNLPGSPRVFIKAVHLTELRSRMQ
ncbi:MAG TPA: hypothetical protein VGQ46_10470 [Thermoanaerobaculia bacterium]|nr:hypothetical protein [Thermoanaerobaculia bacterium]